MPFSHHCNGLLACSSYWQITLLIFVFYWQNNSNFFVLQSLTNIIFSHTSSNWTFNYNHKNSAHHVISASGTRLLMHISLQAINSNKYEISNITIVLSIQRLQMQCSGNFIVQLTWNLQPSGIILWWMLVKWRNTQNCWSNQYSTVHIYTMDN